MEEPAPTAPEGREICQSRLNCLLEEYRAMYGLVLFRMTSLDRRVPIAGVALTATLASVSAMPKDALMIVFIGLPLALVWFLRTTINHARSFEDVLRRIEWIEKEINAVLGSETMSFQSRHPSRGQRVGGRTSRETIGAVLITVVTLLVGCAFMFPQLVDAPWQGRAAYIVFLGLDLAYLVMIVIRLKQYEYLPQ